MVNFSSGRWGPTPSAHGAQRLRYAQGLAASSFHLEVAARKRGRTFRAESVDQRLRVLRLLALVPVIVHADDRRAIAGTEALDFDERELAVLVGVARGDAQGVRQLGRHALGTHQ